MDQTRSVWPVVLWLGSVACGFAASPASKLAEDLRSRTGDVDVIVQFKDGYTAWHEQRMQRRGWRLRHELEAAGGAAYRVPADRLGELAGDPDVEYVSPDREVAGTAADVAKLDFSYETVLANIARKYGSTGKGVGVAVIDSGIDPQHADFRTSGLLGTALLNTSYLAYSQNFVAGESDIADRWGHGTHVAGILAGNGQSSSSLLNFYTFNGVAPGVRIVNLRVLNKYGRGTDSAVIAAIDRAIKLKPTYNIRVITLSLGRPVFESYVNDPLCQAVERAWKTGIVVVVPAMRAATTRRALRGTQRLRVLAITHS